MEIQNPNTMRNNQNQSPFQHTVAQRALISRLSSGREADEDLFCRPLSQNPQICQQDLNGISVETKQDTQKTEKIRKTREEERIDMHRGTGKMEKRRRI